MNHLPWHRERPSSERGTHGIKKQSREGAECAARGKEGCLWCVRIILAEEAEEGRERIRTAKRCEWSNFGVERELRALQDGAEAKSEESRPEPLRITRPR
jgi:hypothetical protein